MPDDLEISNPEEELDGEGKPKPKADPLAPLRAELEALKQQNSQLSNMVRQMAQAKNQPQNAGEEQPFRDKFGGNLDKIFQKHGLDLSKQEIKLWREVLADVIDTFNTEGLKPFTDWQKLAEDEIFSVKDQAGLAHFLLDPANANLKREILPELQRIYKSEALYNPPEGHQGEWKPWHKAYDRFKEMQKLAGIENPAGPRPGRVPTGAPASAPANRSKTETFRPKESSFADRFLKENPDFAETLESVGASGMLRGDHLEEE